MASCDSSSLVTSAPLLSQGSLIFLDSSRSDMIRSVSVVGKAGGEEDGKKMPL